ncbi:MAG: carbohydrate-binding family 9-like protein [Anaerolineae bacterium]|nr:carbohydrate-binding family 9-like protein [Phycisphaerae bacterium]
MQTNPKPDPAGEWSKMRAITPQAYVCPRAPSPITIDGKLDDPAWQAARWTHDFVDIEGPSKPAPRFRTRAKMLWDDENLYVAAELAEPHVVATLTEKNSVIYHDNDFEIFIDPDGDNHNYYEFEMNAFNTIWELTLPKPYKDGGEPKLGTNLPGLKSAVSIDGTINNPRDTDRGWSLEVALPWKDLATYNAGRATPPRDGNVWRMNFSRVQWIYDVVDGKYVRRKRETNPEDNWVWSPQGIIDMHRPERWGYVMFARDANAKPTNDTPDFAMKERDALMEINHRQRVYKQANGKWATELSQMQIQDRATRMDLTADGFVATIEFVAPDARKYAMHVRQDSRLWWEAIR